jgi:hypothetical protein
MYISHIQDISRHDPFLFLRPPSGTAFFYMGAAASLARHEAPEAGSATLTAKEK